MRYVRDCLSPDRSVRPLRVEPETGELRKEGTRLKLQDQPFKVLCLLLEHPGELVKREDLKNALMPEASFGDFDHAINVAVAKLRLALCDSSDTPRYIETLPRRGYRFIGDVSARSLETAADEPASAVSSAVSPRAGNNRQLRYATRVACVLLFVAATVLTLRWSGLWWRWFPLRIQSLVVLPLVNLSGQAEQGYFADGMTEALISELARVRDLRVVSRTSAMQFKGTHESVPAIARKLSVDGVIEASVMRSGDRVRIRAQLIHAATDKPVWVGAYDRDLRDILTLQTEVAQAIAQAIRLEITPAGRERRARNRPIDPEAHQHYLAGLYYYQRQGQSPEGQ